MIYRSAAKNLLNEKWMIYSIDVILDIWGNTKYKKLTIEINKPMNLIIGRLFDYCLNTKE